MAKIESGGDLHAAMTAWRRHLHAHPETAFEEHATAAFIAERLESFGGITVERGIAGTGVVGTLRNGDGPGIGLRADMDALRMPRKRTSSLTAQRIPARCTPAATTAIPPCCSVRPSIWRDTRALSRHRAVHLPAGRGERGRRSGDGRGRAVRALPGRRGLRPAQLAGHAGGPHGAGDGADDGVMRPASRSSSLGRGCHAAMPHLGSDTVLAGRRWCWRCKRSPAGRSTRRTPRWSRVTQVRMPATPGTCCPSAPCCGGTVRAFRQRRAGRAGSGHSARLRAASRRRIAVPPKSSMIGAIRRPSTTPRRPGGRRAAARALG